MKREYTRHIKLIALWTALLLLFTCMTGYAEESRTGTNRLEIHFIDVGMGDAILLRDYNNGAVTDMMIDTGDRNHTVAVTDYLKEQGVTDLQYLVLTHPHADHIGGANRILDNFTIQDAVLAPMVADTATYEKLMAKIDDKGFTPVLSEVGVVV